MSRLFLGSGGTLEVGLVPLSRIRMPTKPLRAVVDEEHVIRLAENIKRVGLVMPILVRPVDNHYELVAGMRRLMACKQANVKRVRCLIGLFSEKQALEAAFSENLHRQDLDPISEAKFLHSYMTKYEFNHSKLAKEFGLSRAYVSNRLRLLYLSSPVQGYLQARLMNADIGLTLLRVQNINSQIEIAREAVMKKLTVREVRGLTQRCGHKLDKKSRRCACCRLSSPTLVHITICSECLSNVRSLRPSSFRVKQSVQPLRIPE